MVASGIRRTKHTSPLISLISSEFKSKRDVPPLKAGDYLRVSGLSSLCPREEALRSIHNVIKPDNVDADLNMIFAHGAGIHSILQNRVLPSVGVLYGRWICLGCAKMYGAQLEGQTLEESLAPRPQACSVCKGEEFYFQEHSFISDQYHITGHPDGFLRLPQYEGTGLLEAKSISNRGVWEVRNCAKMDHVVQAQLYLWFSGFKWAQILYWDKGTNGVAALVEHHIERDDDAIQAALDTINLIWAGVNRTIMPDRICTTKDCPRASVCVVSAQCFAEAA